MLKGGLKIKYKMNKKLLWIIGAAVLILLAVVIWQTVAISSLGGGGNVGAVSSGGMVGGC